jgi:hypothetical protein
MCPAALADGVDRAGAFADPEGRAVPLLPAPGLPAARLALAEPLALEPLALEPLALEPLALEPAALEAAGPELAAPVRCGPDRIPEAAVAEGRPGCSCPVAGLNVATDSMAPATRQTARMLASSGITVPGPRSGVVSRRSRCRRRWARSSRW